MVVRFTTRYNTEHYVIKFVSDLQWFSPGTLVSSTNKTDRHNKSGIKYTKPPLPTHKVDLLYFVTQLRYKYNCEILLINLTIVSAATVIVHRLLTSSRNYLWCSWQYYCHNSWHRVPVTYQIYTGHESVVRPLLNIYKWHFNRSSLRGQSYLVIPIRYLIRYKELDNPK